MGKALNQIEFWIILFFLIRMTGITNPPLEPGHNWRQATGLMVARNYLEVDANILYPRIDDNNGETGIIGMEFPALNYLYFLVARIFGYAHWYGRLINLIISSFGLFFFYKLVNKYFGHRHALLSALCLIGSIWFAFSRKMMPDTFCISLMLTGVFYGTEYLDNGGKRPLILYLILVTLAMLAKIPAGIYLAVFIPLLILQKNRNRRIILCSATTIPLIVSYIWYFIWNPYLSITYGHWYNSGKGFSAGSGEIIANIGLTLKRFYFSAFNSYLFFVIFAAGLVLIFASGKKKLIYPFLSVGAVFVIYMIKSGSFFYSQDYYIIPFVPVMALVAGYALSLIKNKYILVSILSLGIFESMANQKSDYFIKKSEKYKLQLETIADSVSSGSDLIVINGNGSPQQIYLTHRKGWSCDDRQLRDSVYLNGISEKGCRFLFVNNHSFSDLLDYKIVLKNSDYTVYEFSKADPGQESVSHQ